MAPIFDIECALCAHQVEILMRHSDKVEDEICPQCNEKSMVKKLNSFANYKMNGPNNGGTTRPKNPGNMKAKK